MPAKDFLSREEKSNLQQALKIEEKGDVRERILMFLLLNDGKTQQEVADFIGCSLRTVAYWFKHGDPSNLDSLQDKRSKGNYKKVTPEYLKLLLEIIDKEPKDFGYEFGRWTAARLAEHLEKETKISLSSSRIRRILKKNKYVYIWGKSSLEDKQDKEKRKEFKIKLDNYLRLANERPSDYQVWFWDECGFSLRVIRRRDWTKKGKRKKVNGIRRRGRVNVMGALRSTDKKRICFMIKQGNSESFYSQLNEFYNEIIKEWEAAGNKVEEFPEKGPKIIIVLDNASYHKKQGMIDKIEKELPNIQLEYLPPYSPDYNLIELVWHSAKEYIAHREFKTKEELEKIVNQLLNEGLLIIKWSKKRKNKGNAVNAA
jgi:transposase